jgi:hypothetical protein
MMYKLFSVVLIFTCASCASIATWHYSDATLASFLQNRRTHCESLPRIYSGVYFDYCWLDSDPQRVYGSAPIALLLVDGLFSGIADTFALPFTVAQQQERGGIPLKRTASISVSK